MKWARLLAWTSLVVLLWAPGASATSCRDWGRLSPDQKPMTIDRMIQDAISGQAGRSYQVNRNAIARCLQRYSRDIEIDFDDACSSNRTSGSQALNNIFKRYIWSCVG